MSVRMESVPTLKISGEEDVEALRQILEIAETGLEYADVVENCKGINVKEIEVKIRCIKEKLINNPFGER